MNKIALILCMVLLLIVTLSSFYSLTSQVIKVPYQTGFREWNHIKTSVTGIGKPEQKKYDGLHHIYANSIAMLGFRSGKFPEGSIIVFDKHETITTSDQLETGKRKLLNVMQKDSGAFAETGGWGFEEFTGDSRDEGRLSILEQTNCFTRCHRRLVNSDFVFSQYVE